MSAVAEEVAKLRKEADRVSEAFRAEKMTEICKQDMKLYVVVRSDLKPGSQAVQAVHVASQFIVDFQAEFRHWFETSNTLALLSVPDEGALKRLAVKADDLDLKVSAFREPDLGNALTAIALEPGARSQKLCRSLPLALGG